MVEVLPLQGQNRPKPGSTGNDVQLHMKTVVFKILLHPTTSTRKPNSRIHVLYK